MSKIEIIFEIIDLSFEFIGLVLIIFGWIVPYIQLKREEMKRRKYEEKTREYERKKEIIDDQISKLYGPISALLKEQDIRFSLIQYQMGKTYIFERDQWKITDLTREEQKIWIHYVDTYLLPTNQEILLILNNNLHLIYKSEIPTSLTLFQKYALGWELLDNQKRNGVPNYYEYYYLINFPREFKQYIDDTLKILLKYQSDLFIESEYPSTAF